jgi:hypothetical protein
MREMYEINRAWNVMKKQSPSFSDWRSMQEGISVGQIVLFSSS